MKENKCYAGYTNNDLINEIRKLKGQVTSHGEKIRAGIQKTLERSEDEPVEDEPEKEGNGSTGYTISDLIDGLYEQKNIVKEGLNDSFLRSLKAVPEDEPEDDAEDYSQENAFYGAADSLIDVLSDLDTVDMLRMKLLILVMRDYAKDLHIDERTIDKMIEDVREGNFDGE